MTKSNSMAKVTGLFVYPVKSMKGVEVDSARLTPLGLEHDRRFMVVRSNGDFVTQRDTPLMALIKTALQSEGVSLSREGFGQVYVPFDCPPGNPIQTRVWKDVCETTDQGQVVSDWLTAALESEQRLHLVAMADGFTRPQGKADLLGADTRTLFADAAPFLVANEASLAQLNRELESRSLEAVPMNRFRPNIVIKGPKAFAEHALPGLVANAYELGFRHPCERCVVTTIDQSTANRHPRFEPYKTLCSINPMPGRDNKPAFGHNALLAKGQNTIIRSGDLLEPMETCP